MIDFSVLILVLTLYYMYFNLYFLGLGRTQQIEQMYLKNTNLELIRVRHFTANASQLSVRVSISALTCNHSSRFSEPNKPIFKNKSKYYYSESPTAVNRAENMNFIKTDLQHYFCNYCTSL